MASGKMSETRVVRRRMQVVLLPSGVTVTYLKQNQTVSCKYMCMWQL